MSQANEAKDLRRFGVLVGGIFVAVALWPLVFRGEAARGWAAVVGAVLVVGGLLSPQALGPLYRVWMRLGETLGWLNTRLILGGTYYLMITPIAVLRRLQGRDSLDRRLNDRPSYWIPRQPTGDPRALMERRF